MSIITNKRKTCTTYTAVVRKGEYRTKPLRQTFPTKGEAVWWKADQERLIDMKKHRDPRLADRVSLRDALGKYRDYSKTVLKKADSTLAREIYSRKHLERILGKETPLSEINQGTVARYQTKRITEAASSSSIRQELAMLSRMYRVAKSAWMLPVDNPLDNVDRIPQDKGRTRFLSDQEAAIVIATTKTFRNKKFYPYVLLLMHTGMRSGEAARLTINDVDFDRRLLTIHETKTDQPRAVGITQEVIDALRSIEPFQDGYFFLKPSHRTAARIIHQPGIVFRSCWTRLWRILKDKHENIPYFKPHDIRHTAASHLLRQGINIGIIADILGHSGLQMVMRYTHLFDESKVEYADKISYLGATKEKTDE